MDDKRLNENKTQKSKEEILQDAYIIASSGDQKPSKEAIDITKEYADGKITLEEMKKRIISIYKKEGGI